MTGHRNLLDSDARLFTVGWYATYSITPSIYFSTISVRIENCSFDKTRQRSASASRVVSASIPKRILSLETPRVRQSFFNVLREIPTTPRYMSEMNCGEHSRRSARRSWVMFACSLA